MVRTLREQDSALLGRLALIEKGYLAVVALIAGGALCVQLIPAASHLLPGGWAPGTPQVALALMLSAAALEFTGPRNTAGVKRIGMVLAVVLALLAGAELLRSRSYLPPIPATSPDRQAEAMLSQGQPQPMTALTAAAFPGAGRGNVSLLSPQRFSFPRSRFLCLGALPSDSAYGAELSIRGAWKWSRRRSNLAPDAFVSGAVGLCCVHAPRGSGRVFDADGSG